MLSTSNSASSVPTIRKPLAGETFDPELDDVVGHEPEADQTLAAAIAAQRRRLELVAEETGLLPRILAQVAHADVELNRRHEVDLIEARALHRVSDRIHHRSRHARGPKALLRIAKRRIDDADGARGLRASYGRSVGGRVAPRSTLRAGGATGTVRAAACHSLAVTPASPETARRRARPSRHCRRRCARSCRARPPSPC